MPVNDASASQLNHDEPVFQVSRPVKGPSPSDRPSLRMALVFQGVALLLDIVSVVLAFRIGYALRYHLEFGGEISPETWRTFSTFAPPAFAGVMIMLVVFPLRGVYQLRHRYSALDYIPKLIGGFSIVIAGVIILAFFFQFSPSRLIFLYVGLFGIAFLVGHRALASVVRHWFWRRGIGVDRVLIVGEGRSGRRIMQSMLGNVGLGYRLVGYVGDSNRGDKVHVATEHGILTCPRLGTLEDVRDLVSRHKVDEVLVVEDGQGGVDVQRVLDQCRGTNAQFRIVPDLIQISLDRVDFAEIDGVPTIGVRDASIRGWSAIAKRTVDILLAGIVGLVTAVPMMVIAFLIKRDSEGPVFYTQTRVGQYGKPFTLIKFRCMVNNADQQWAEMAKASGTSDGARLFKDPNDPRITRIGKFLRRYSTLR